MIKSIFILLLLAYVQAIKDNTSSIVRRNFAGSFDMLATGLTEAGRKVRARFRPSKANTDAWKYVEQGHLNSLTLANGYHFGELNGGWLSQAIHKGDQKVINNILTQNQLSAASQDALLKYAIRVGNPHSMVAVLKSSASQSVEGILSAMHFSSKVNPKATRLLYKTFEDTSIIFDDVPVNMSPKTYAFYLARDESLYNIPQKEYWKQIYNSLLDQQRILGSYKTGRNAALAGVAGAGLTAGVIYTG